MSKQKLDKFIVYAPWLLSLQMLIDIRDDGRISGDGVLNFFDFHWELQQPQVYIAYLYFALFGH